MDTRKGREEMERKKLVQGMACILFCLALLAGEKEIKVSKEPEETGKEELYTQEEEYLSYLYVKGEEGIVICEYLGEEKTLVIPDKIQGVPVVEIRGLKNTDLEKVVLPDSVKIIGDYVFDECKDLREIQLPANIKSIGEFAFQRCWRLEEIHLPDGLESIGDFAFEECQNLM